MTNSIESVALQLTVPETAVDALTGLCWLLSPRGVLVLEVGNEREHFENAFPALQAVWLETSAGEDQVLLLTTEALAQAGTN